MLKKIYNIFSVVLLISILLISQPLSAAQDSNILSGVTTGKRKIYNNNPQQAKQNAVSDALRVAVQNAFAKVVSRQVLASNLEFFYNNVLSNTSDYIITYRVLGGVENKGYYLVGVESKVDILKLEKTLTDAKILNANKDKPVILFFVVEKTPSDLLPKYWWGKNPIPYEPLAETIIIDKLIQDRFPVTGNERERPDPSFYDISFKSIYDVDAAKELGKKMAADIIIFGKAFSEEAINRMGEEKTFNAQVNLDGYHVGTGEKVFTSQVKAVAKNEVESVGNIQALIKAANLSAPDLSGKLSAYWTAFLRKEHSFDVTIKGDNFLPRFIALKQQFNKMPEIENMQPIELGSNYAVMQIFYKGQSSQFANAVMLKTFDSFGLEFSDINDTYMTIRFIEKDTATIVEE